ncbi:MAG: CHAT domain-containing protein [Planctomycetes bacterium]|nr:CHAT domain-containing protein [Planctomycetota bacterium]
MTRGHRSRAVLFAASALWLHGAGKAQTATLREQAESARRVLEGDPPPAELEAALATMRELFARRHDQIADADTATAIVLAIGTLAEYEQPEAMAELQTALDLYAEHRLYQLTSWVTGLWIYEAQDPGTAIDRLREAIPKFAGSPDRVPDTESQYGRYIVDLCCQEWRLADAEAVLTWMRDLPALADDNRRELVAGEVAGAEFRLLLQRGEPERALPFLERAKVHLAKTDDANPLRASLQANHTLDQTRYLLGNDQFGAAVTRIDELLQQPRHAPAVLAHLQLARGLALAAGGKAAAAEAQLAAIDDLEGVSASDRVRALARRARIAVESQRTTAAADHLEAARAMLATTGEPIGLEVRAAVHGMSVHLQRQQEQPDPGAVRADREELARILQALLAHVDRTDAEFGGIGFLHFEDAHQILADLIDAELTLAGDDAGRRAAVAAVLRAHAHGSLSRALDAKGSLDDIRAALPTTGGALVYVPSWRGGHLFAIDRESITHARLGPRDGLERVAKNVAGRLLQPGADDSLVAAARKAGTELLPDGVLAAIADWSTVIVCGTETLGQLPFESLLLPDGRLLGEVKAIANLSALTLLPKLLARPRATPMRKIGFVGQLAPEASVLRSLGQEPARLTDEVLAPLLEPFGKQDRTVLTDAGATPAAVANLPFSTLDVVHILAHGCSDPTRRFGHGIALGPDAQHGSGVLWPEAVLAWPVRGLVILSACNAGRAPRRVGEDHAANFGGALLRAGAHGVIQARGTLVTAELLPLVVALHRELAAGTEVAEALRRARVAAGSATLARRFHAAQLQLFGAWR